MKNPGPILTRMQQLTGFTVALGSGSEPVVTPQRDVDECTEGDGGNPAVCLRCSHVDDGSGFYQCPHYNGREEIPCPLDVDFPSDRDRRAHKVRADNVIQFPIFNDIPDPCDDETNPTGQHIFGGPNDRHCIYCGCKSGLDR